MEEIRYRVMNKCRYTIGCLLPNGQRVSILPNSFKLLTLNDILFIDSVCANEKYFGKKMLVPIDQNGKEIPLETITSFIDVDQHPHLDSEEITKMFRQSAKKISEWLDDIDDPAELYDIYLVAKDMDLPASKLKLLAQKMPDRDMLDMDE